jgi:hypothetical protein
METVATIGCIQDLFALTTAQYFAEQRGRWVFRGHSKTDFQLIPTVGRNEHVMKTRSDYEQSVFEIFCREARAYLSYESLPENDWEWLSVARHFGLPTRLLDWTHNPLAALYFAVCQHPKCDGQLFALNSVLKRSERIPSKPPFEIEEPVKFYPPYINPRIRAQEGLFVACSKVETPLDEVLPAKWKIERCLIPAAKKKELQYDLFRLGVHASSVYPDMSGLASRVSWQHSVLPPRKPLKRNDDPPEDNPSDDLWCKA